MSKSVNVDFVTRQIEVDTDGKEHFISAAMAAKDAEQSMLSAQNAAESVKKYKALWFDNVATMKAEPSLTAGAYVNTAGYYEPNDGGGASYLIREKLEADVDDGGSLHELANGLVAELIVENGTVNVKQFGAKGDANYYSEAKKKWYADENFSVESEDVSHIFAKLDGKKIYLPEGYYIVHDIVFHANTVLVGKTRITSVLVLNPQYIDSPLLTIQDGYGGVYQNFGLNGSSQLEFDSNNIIDDYVGVLVLTTSGNTMKYNNECVIESISIKNAEHNGFVITGKNRPSNADYNWVFHINDIFVSGCKGYCWRDASSDNKFSNIMLSSGYMGNILINGSSNCYCNVKCDTGTQFVQKALPPALVTMDDSSNILFTNLDLQTCIGYALCLRKTQYCNIKFGANNIFYTDYSNEASAFIYFADSVAENLFEGIMYEVNDSKALSNIIYMDGKNIRSNVFKIGYRYTDKIGKTVATREHDNIVQNIFYQNKFPDFNMDFAVENVLSNTHLNTSDNLSIGGFNSYQFTTDSTFFANGCLEVVCDDSKTGIIAQTFPVEEGYYMAVIPSIIKQSGSKSVKPYAYSPLTQMLYGFDAAAGLKIFNTNEVGGYSYTINEKNVTLTYRLYKADSAKSTNMQILIPNSNETIVIGNIMFFKLNATIFKDIMDGWAATSTAYSTFEVGYLIKSILDQIAANILNDTPSKLSLKVNDSNSNVLLRYCLRKLSSISA